MEEAAECQELHALALRMRREMQCKERIIHLQTFKWTFHGQQAVAYLVKEAIAADTAAAVDICQRMLQQGLFKSIYHKDQFTADAELYRFSSSMLDNKHKGLTSLTSTGLYKEIAKFGKAAAQPFKQVQVSLNDTFANLGSLSSAVAPRLGAIGTNATNSSNHTPVMSPGRSARFPTRRSTTGRSQHDLLGQGRIDAEGSQVTLATVVAELQALQAVIKESSGLLRIDLQQHTALQEHLVGLLVAQQAHNQCMHKLVAITAAAVALLLAATAAPAAWPMQLLAAALLTAVAVLSIPKFVSIPQLAWPAQNGIAAGILGAAAVEPATSLRDASRPLMKQHSKSAVKLDAASSQPSIVADTGSGEISAPAEHSDSDSMATDWEELGPTLDDFEDWPDAPVMLCPDPAVPKQAFAYDSMGPCQALPLNSIPIPFESELFRGVMVIYIRHLSTTPGHIFKGKKRLTWIAIQGSFKRPASMDSLVFGQEFSHKLCNLPAPWFIDNMLLPLARKISPALRVGNLEQPYLYSPLITASQIVNVSMPGSAPPLMDAKEDVSLITGVEMSVAARRKHFQSAANRMATPFTTKHVWTFHLWQEYLDYAAYVLNLGYSSYDLTQHLDGQPLQVMVKDVSNNSYLVNLHVWHSNLLRSSARHLTRPPTRLRPGRPAADMQVDHSTQVSKGGAAPQAEPVTPGSDLPDIRVSDAGTAATAGTAGTDFSSKPDLDDQQQVLLQQAQSPVTSPIHANGRADLPGIEPEEHWFDRRYSSEQHNVWECQLPESTAGQQQQQLGQRHQRQRSMEEQQQQRSIDEQQSLRFSLTQSGSGSGHEKSPPLSGSGILSQQQQQRRVQSRGQSQQSSSCSSPKHGLIGAEPAPTAGQASKLPSRGSSGEGAAAGTWLQLCGQLTSHTTDEEPLKSVLDGPSRSGASASTAATTSEEARKQLQSMRSL